MYRAQHLALWAGGHLAVAFGGSVLILVLAGLGPGAGPARAPCAAAT
ncbi:hypothetical protein ACFWSF_05070 [Streptomyces sp. NPDC058611]